VYLGTFPSQTPERSRERVAANSLNLKGRKEVRIMMLLLSITIVHRSNGSVLLIIEWY
jgi:hypothetical protein